MSDHPKRADPRDQYPPLEGEWEQWQLQELVAMQRREASEMYFRHSTEVVRLAARLRKERLTES